MAERDDEHHATEPEAERDDRSPTTSFWPIGFAAGVALLLVGVVLNWVVFGIGIALALLFGVLWAAGATGGGRPAPAAVAAEGQEEAEEPERYGRNAFLERTTLGLGAIIGGAVTIPVVGFAVAPTFIGQDDEEIDLGSIENFPEGEWRVTTFRSKEREGAVSRQTAFIRNNGTANGQPSYTIISNRCVHLGCPTQPAGPTEDPEIVDTPEGPVRLIPAQPSGFVCPCHGGSYDLEGNRTAGPPVRSLDRFTYKIVDGKLVLDERYSVAKVEGEGADAVITAHTRYDPGQHVDGPDAWMYPASPRGV